ncbi:hypothetical protein JW905_16360 [bacterium]|nr:hypothetical protein [candidate division CSSED10-310 bacterium]
MTKLLLSLLVGLTIIAAGGVAVTAAAEIHRAPLSCDDNSQSSQAAGFIPPNYDPRWLEEPLRLEPGAVSRDADWRSYCPNVRYQGNCGTCWIFAALGDMETQLNINGMGLYDFSEDHLKECNVYDTGCAGGGNFIMAGNYLNKSGARLESCQPYHQYEYYCVSSCQPQVRLREYRVIAPTTLAIQDALAEGPVISSINSDAWGNPPSGAFYTYNGSYVLSGGSGPTNHTILIVGYDDPAFPPGHWIVRNSWGTDWGEDGYGYIAYGAGGIGAFNAQYTAFEEPLSDQDLDLVHFDNYGPESFWGNGVSNVAWGCVEVIPEYDGVLRRIEFFTSATNWTMDARVYNSKSGTSPTMVFYNQLFRATASNVETAGYYSVDVDPPLEITEGNDIFLAVRFQVASGGYPVPADSMVPIDGNSYLSISGTGSTWQTVPFDVCIRAVTQPEPVVPAVTPVGLGILLAGVSLLLIRRRR